MRTDLVIAALEYDSFISKYERAFQELNKRPEMKK